MTFSASRWKTAGRAAPIGGPFSGTDPSTIPLEQLAKIRGSMWTARLNLPFGPRPGQDSNILAMDFYELFSPEDQARMLVKYKAPSYTHAVTGPLTGGDGYHGQFPDPFTYRLPTQAEFDHYLDGMQEWWDRDIKPIHFCHPDGWTLAQMAQLEPFYLQERAQRLLRIVVPTGWEPAKYEWTNATWVAMAQWGARLFPNALRLIHLYADVDAPTGGNDDQTLGPNGNATAWALVAPYLHGWLVQNGGYALGSSPVPSAEFLAGFRQLYDRNARGSLPDRFRNGYAGWPTSSAWGQGKPLKVYAAEYASYGDYWKNFPEAEAVKLGNLAMALGADGYLDGGTVPV